MTIKEMRVKTGLTQAKFAELLGIPRRSIENWESGASKCPDYTIRFIDYYLTKEKAYREE